MWSSDFVVLRIYRYLYPGLSQCNGVVEVWKDFALLHASGANGAENPKRAGLINIAFKTTFTTRTATMFRPKSF